MAIGNRASNTVNKPNIISYNNACIELLRLLVFTLYIHSLCVSRRAELARGQRRRAVLYVIDAINTSF